MDNRSQRSLSRDSTPRQPVIQTPGSVLSPAQPIIQTPVSTVGTLYPIIGDSNTARPSAFHRYTRPSMDFQIINSIDRQFIPVSGGIYQSPSNIVGPMTSAQGFAAVPILASDILGQDRRSEIPMRVNVIRPDTIYINGYPPGQVLLPYVQSSPQNAYYRMPSITDILPVISYPHVSGVANNTSPIIIQNRVANQIPVSSIGETQTDNQESRQVFPSEVQGNSGPSSNTVTSESASVVASENDGCNSVLEHNPQFINNSLETVETDDSTVGQADDGGAPAENQSNEEQEQALDLSQKSRMSSVRLNETEVPKELPITSNLSEEPPSANHDSDILPNASCDSDIPSNLSLENKIDQQVDTSSLNCGKVLKNKSVATNTENRRDSVYDFELPEYNGPPRFIDNLRRIILERKLRDSAPKSDLKKDEVTSCQPPRGSPLNSKQSEAHMSESVSAATGVSSEIKTHYSGKLDVCTDGFKKGTTTEKNSAIKNSDNSINRDNIQSQKKSGKDSIKNTDGTCHPDRKNTKEKLKQAKKVPTSNNNICLGQEDDEGCVSDVSDDESVVSVESYYSIHSLPENPLHICLDDESKDDNSSSRSSEESNNHDINRHTFNKFRFQLEKYSGRKKLEKETVAHEIKKDPEAKSMDSVVKSSDGQQNIVSEKGGLPYPAMSNGPGQIFNAEFKIVSCVSITQSDFDRISEMNEDDLSVLTQVAKNAKKPRDKNDINVIVLTKEKLKISSEKNTLLGKRAKLEDEAPSIPFKRGRIDRAINGCASHNIRQESRFKADSEYRKWMPDKFDLRVSNSKMMLRPPEIFMYGKYYPHSHKLSTREFQPIIKRSKNYVALQQYIQDHCGKHITVGWPRRFALYVMSEEKLMFGDTLQKIKDTFPLPAGWMMVLGFVAVKCNAPRKAKNQPVVILCQNGWVLVYSNCKDKDELFLAAKTPNNFVNEGLSHCDCIFREASVPYGTYMEYHLLKMVKNCSKLADVLSYRSYLNTIFWAFNGMPGRMCDRVLRICDPKMEGVPADGEVESRGRRLYVFAYISTFENQPATECNLFIAVDNSLKVYGCTRDGNCVWFLAESLAVFFKIGTRKAYLDYEIYPKKFLRVSETEVIRAMDEMPVLFVAQ